MRRAVKTVADLPTFPLYPLEGPPPAPVRPLSPGRDTLLVAQCQVLAWLSSRHRGYEASAAEVFEYLLKPLGRDDSDYVLQTLVDEGRLSHKAVPCRGARGGLTHRYRLARKAEGGGP